VIKQNLPEFTLLNIPVWHEKGYTGKGIRVAELESVNPDTWFLKHKLHDPFNIGNDQRCNSHGQKVIDIINQVAPDAQIYSLPNSKRYTHKGITGDFVDKTIPFAIKEGIHIIGASLGGSDNDDLNKIILEAQKYGIVFTTSAGNKGKKGLGSYARSDLWISVGALGLRGDDFDDIYLKSYSSRGQELDVVSFSGLYVRDAKQKGRVFKQEGTSFSHPLFLGMLALMQQLFLEKIGRTLYQDEVLLFVKDHVVDLGDTGRDELYGHGLFILPDPQDIDPLKYLLHGRCNDMYKDLNNHWSKEYVEIIERHMPNIFNGFPDGTFKPDKPLTRGEIAKIICVLKGWK
jgi:hypothetical protein